MPRPAFALALAMAAVAALITACGETAAPGSSGTTPTGSGPPSSQEVNPGGDIPDTLAFPTFSFPSGAFTVRAPEGWARADSGSAVTFTSNFDSVQLQAVALGTSPTVASVMATEVPAIQQQASHASIGNVSTVTRNAGQAILITYQADSAPDPVTGRTARLDVQRYDFWRAGTEAVITLAAPVGSDNVDPWRLVTDSFQWV